MRLFIAHQNRFDAPSEFTPRERIMIEDRSESAPDGLSVELQGFLQRTWYALGPLGAGIILDVLDLATFGAIGIFAGAIVGGYAGWMLAGFEGHARNIRIAFAICAAAYMTMPFTEMIPVATMLMLAARFFAGPKPAATDSEMAQVPADHSIESK